MDKVKKELSQNIAKKKIGEKVREKLSSWDGKGVQEISFVPRRSLCWKANTKTDYQPQGQ